jgi:hydroxymethylbilane synthase
MANFTLRIITRESPLALWQAKLVRESLLGLFADIDVTIVGITTEADKFFDTSLDKLGGKGAFVKELEQALLEDRADIAVHSMKDVVVNLPAGLAIPAILKRAEPGDAYVSNNTDSLDRLPAGSLVGTSSLRRQTQLKACRSDLIIKSIRGNIGTRLRKLDAGDYDALILASSGLCRLGLEQRIRHELDMKLMLPAIGQGALGVEVRENDKDIWKYVQALNDLDTFQCVTAERMVNKCLNGGCHAPIAAYATKQGNVISISGLVGSADGSQIIRSELSGPAATAAELGHRLGQELLERGAEDILAEFRTTQGS